MHTTAKQTYIKGISISKKEFKELNDSIYYRYINVIKNVSFLDFQKGIIFAFILGNLSAHGDRESIRLFCYCLESNYIPELKILEYENEIKMYLYMKI